MFEEGERRRRKAGTTRAAVRNLLAAGLRPSEIALRLGVTKSTVAFHMRRLDIEVDERCARRYDWEEIQRAYDSGLSVRQCAAKFGFNLASWHKAVQRGAIVTRPAAMPIEVLLVKGRVQTNRSHLKQRLVQAGLKDDRCERCGIDEWLGKPLSTQLHHKDGDGTNNELENLEILCPNCHSLTDTWGGRNGHRRKKAA